MIDTVMTTYPVMDPEVKVKWVEALRSGQFKQGEGYLKTRDGCNCCLGVLAEITGIQSKPSECEIDDGSYSYSFPNPSFPDGYNYEIHETPIGYCGIAKQPRNELMNMNDDGMPFPEIADWIERNL